MSHGMSRSPFPIVWKFFFALSRKGLHGSFEGAFAIPGDEEAADGAAEVGFPADVAGAGDVGGEHGVDGATVEDDDEEGEEDGARGALVEAGADEVAEVAEDDGARADVDGAGFSDGEDEDPGGEGGDPGGLDDVAPALHEDGGSENHEGDRVSDEMIPSGVEKRSEEDAFPVGEVAGVDAVAIKPAAEEDAVDELHHPEADDDAGVVGEALGVF